MNISNISYTVAQPDKFLNYDNNNNEFADYNRAKELKAESIMLSYKGNDLNKKGTKNFIKSLMNQRKSRKDTIKNIKVKGTDSLGKHIDYDPINDKLTSQVDVFYLEKIEIKDYLDALKEGYVKEYRNVIKDMFN